MNMQKIKSLMGFGKKALVLAAQGIKGLQEKLSSSAARRAPITSPPASWLQPSNNCAGAAGLGKISTRFFLAAGTCAGLSFFTTGEFFLSLNDITPLNLVFAVTSAAAIALLVWAATLLILNAKTSVGLALCVVAWAPPMLINVKTDVGGFHAMHDVHTAAQNRPVKEADQVREATQRLAQAYAADKAVAESRITHILNKIDQNLQQDSHKQLSDTHLSVSVDTQADMEKQDATQAQLQAQLQQWQALSLDGSIAKMANKAAWTALQQAYYRLNDRTASMHLPSTGSNFVQAEFPQPQSLDAQAIDKGKDDKVANALTEIGQSSALNSAFYAVSYCWEIVPLMLAFAVRRVQREADGLTSEQADEQDDEWYGKQDNSEDLHRTGRNDHEVFDEATRRVNRIGDAVGKESVANWLTNPAAAMRRLVEMEGLTLATLARRHEFMEAEIQQWQDFAERVSVAPDKLQEILLGVFDSHWDKIAKEKAVADGLHDLGVKEQLSAQSNGSVEKRNGPATPSGVVDRSSGRNGHHALAGSRSRGKDYE